MMVPNMPNPRPAVAAVSSISLRQHVALQRPRNDIIHGHGPAETLCGVAQGLDETGIEFEAAAISAPAQRTCWIDRHVTEFAGTSRCTCHHPSAVDDGTTDTEVDLEQHEIFNALRGPPHHFGESGAIALVVGENRTFENRAKDTAQAHAFPGWQDAGAHDPARCGIDRAREGESQTQESGYRK